MPQFRHLRIRWPGFVLGWSQLKPHIPRAEQVSCDSCTAGFCFWFQHGTRQQIKCKSTTSLFKRRQRPVGPRRVDGRVRLGLIGRRQRPFVPSVRDTGSATNAVSGTRWRRTNHTMTITLEDQRRCNFACNMAGSEQSLSHNRRIPTVERREICLRSYPDPTPQCMNIREAVFLIPLPCTAWSHPFRWFFWQPHALQGFQTRSHPAGKAGAYGQYPPRHLQ